MAKGEHEGRKWALGALIAAVVGYLAGILTAPKSGKETRADIAHKAGEIKDEAEQQLQRLHDELDELIKAAKDKSVALSAKARVEFNEAVVKAKDAREKTATLLKSVKKGEADDPSLNKALKQAKAAKKNLSQFYKS